MSFLLQSSVLTVKGRSISIIVTLLFLANILKPLKPNGNLYFLLIFLPVIIFRTLDSHSQKFHFILDLLYLSATLNFSPNTDCSERSPIRCAGNFL
jgi:hypothetical protein